MGLFAKKRGRLKEKWLYDTKSSLLAGPMVYDVDKDNQVEIVFGTKDGRVIMMNHNSNVKWIYDVKEEVNEVDSYFQDHEVANSIQSSPSIGDIDDDGMNEVVFGTEKGIVYALNNKGIILWKFKAAGAIRASVLLQDVDEDGNLEIVFGCMKGNIYVLSMRGDLMWKYETEVAIESTPTIFPNNKRLVVGCHDGALRCINIHGEQEWEYFTEGKIVARPVIHDLYKDARNVIIVGSTDYHLYVIAEDGDLMWKYKTEGAILAEAKIADIDKDGKNEIIFGSCDNNVYAITNDGDTIWTYETYFWVVAPPIIDDIDQDGKPEVVIGSYDHNIYVLDARGVYALDYVPGLGGVVHQAGHYTDLITHEPGKIQSKKIWQYQTNGFVVGCALDQKYKNIIVNIKEGQVQDIIHEK